MSNFWDKLTRRKTEPTDMEEWARKAVDECAPNPPAAPGKESEKDTRTFEVWITFLTAEGPVREKSSPDHVGYESARKAANSFSSSGAVYRRKGNSGELGKWLSPGAVLCVEIEEITPEAGPR